ncbi:MULTISPECIES: transporter substrate-binding domain-containing protein [unclassified Duganella]|uniref:transporter substrate-binding domain-containing protein n=1 Tax=unclassified Duganella TaxID=2636909 RepID=UPI0008746477|nr:MULTISPECIES: transporter substrate-binding domain-containing protein [unclassified Duganella]OEZ61013.1 major cell-binding factor precursor [Duganella sp. HH105]OFA06335.1 major cell-binding factor precursor [Duganella sp. HH101]
MRNRAFLYLLGLIGMLLLSLAAQAAGNSPALDSIRKKGVIRVGVKTDFSPYNSLNAQGEVVGFESDIAALIAQRLGVTLKKVSITTENRFQKLELGEVDILISTVGDTAARRKIATAVEPGYNETSVNVLFKPGEAVDAWPKIRHETICAVQGSYFNKPMSERYLLELQTYKTVRDAHLALRDGQCSGFLYATAALANTAKLPEWRGYTMPLPNALITPMAIFIARNEQGGELDLTLGNIVAELHRSGWLLEANKRWGIASTSWLTAQKAIWSEHDKDGLYKCVRNSSGNWVAACRSGEYVSSTEVTGVQAVGLWVKEQLGVDLNFIYDPYDRTQFLTGIAYSMLLITCSIAISLALGIAVAIAVDGRSGWDTRAIHTVMAYGRLTPPLLMMYLIFFGFGSWTMREFGLKLPAFAVAAFCSGYYTAGMVMRAFLEAAKHVRSTEPGYRLRLRQLARTAQYANWPVKQALINLTKQTMIASAIAIPELLSASSLLIAEKGNIFLTMTVLLMTFYLITSLWSRLFDYLEQAWLPVAERP